MYRVRLYKRHSSSTTTYRFAKIANNRPRRNRICLHSKLLKTYVKFFTYYYLQKCILFKIIKAKLKLNRCTYTLFIQHCRWKFTSKHLKSFAK